MNGVIRKENEQMNNFNHLNKAVPNVQKPSQKAHKN